MDSFGSTLPPGDIFAGLASSRVEERDDATRMAIAMGPSVAPRLLKLIADSPEGRRRALWAYTGMHLRRAEAALRQAQRMHFQHTGTLATALASLGAFHGVPVAEPIANPDGKVAIDMPNATLLAALDRVVEQAGCRAFQGVRGELVTQLGADPPYPTIYWGPLRVRVTEIRNTRFTDFAHSQESTQLRLRLDWEWPIAPVSSLRVHVDHATRVDLPTPIGGAASEAIVEMPAARGGKVSVSGKVTAAFDGPFEDVRLPVPGTVEVHGLAATARPGDEGGCLLTVEARDPIRARDAGVVGLSPVILALSASGEESLPHVHRVRTMGSAAGAERWGLQVREGFGPVVELRLRIAARPTKSSFAFVLPPLGF